MTESQSNRVVRVAVDTGGTFTDVIATDGAKVVSAKVPSRPEAPHLALASGARKALEKLGFGGVPALLIHGTTVATNALLEEKGATPWLVINAGFEDLLLIGRQHRDDLFAMEPASRHSVVPSDQAVGLPGRRGPRGEQIEALDLAPLEEVIDALDAGARSWAVSLLHSYADPSDEEAVGALIAEKRPQDEVTLSSELSREFREVERTSTAVANAHVAPLMRPYLAQITPQAAEVHVMASSGGYLQIARAVQRPVETALSGPAGGVVAAMDLKQRHGLDALLTFDMGGTSTDVALCGEELPLRYSATIGRFAINAPTLDIHTVGAGGGSVAFVDDGGALRVGPRSAGADPGPACYGKGVEATVTDANVVLGRLPASTMLGGEMPIHAERAHDAVARLAAQLGVEVQRCAEGILRIAVETMAGAIRKVSVERGVDPRTLSLCAFGGAGALHACDLAELLGCLDVRIPARAGLFSAQGMLLGRPTVRDAVTVLGRRDDEIVALREELLVQAEQRLSDSEVTTACVLDARYEGQSFELSVPFEGELGEAFAAFHDAHERRFGYRLEAPVQAVTLRVGVFGALPLPLADELVAEAELARGPASHLEASMTIYVKEGWVLSRRADGDFVLSWERN